jgi:hypothetical protein
LTDCAGLTAGLVEQGTNTRIKPLTNLKPYAILLTT